MPVRPPLSALLNAVLGEFTREVETRLAAAGFPDLTLALGSNVVRFLEPGGIRLGELAGRAGVSKQAISQQVAYLAQRGYVTIEPDPDDQRAKLVVPEERALEAQRLYQSFFLAVERSWGRRYGTAEVQQLRALLEGIAMPGSADRSS